MTYRTAFLVTEEGVLLLDPLNREAAAALKDTLQTLAPNKPLKYIVYSHGHRDHASGADVFTQSGQEDPVILAHQKAAEEVKERNYDDVISPLKTFSGKTHTLEFGGTTLQFIRLPHWQKRHHLFSKPRHGVCRRSGLAQPTSSARGSAFLLRESTGLRTTAPIRV